MFRNPGSRAFNHLPTFTKGTKLFGFVQTSAPRGWTKDTTHNDKAPRIVTGAAASGGTSPFSTVFGLTSTSGYALTLNDVPDNLQVANRAAGAGNVITAINHSTTPGAAHSHAIELRVQYVDMIICTKS